MGGDRHSDVCLCCGGPFDLVVEVPSWRTPDWSLFPYGRCSRCGSLTLLDRVDPSPFYADYERHRRAPGLGRSIGRVAVGAVLERTVMRTAAAGRFVRRPEWLVWFAGSGLTRSARVLDVGAGNGSLLAEMRRWGFRDLHGVDPYLDEAVDVGDGISVAVGSLDDIREPADVVVFHDVLEHVDDPVDHLVAAAGLLRGGAGRIAVALPVAEGPVWEEYRDNWVALDAPVHRFVPTVRGLELLAARAGLRVARSVRDCASYHLTGSERVARRVPRDVRDDIVFSADELDFMRRRTARLRRSGDGPQVTAVLVPEGRT